MPDLDALENEVNGLTGETRPFRFIDVYKHIFEALTDGLDEDRLQRIVAEFRENLPDLPQLDDIAFKAGKLDEALTLQSIGNLIGAINSRNEALDDLKSELDDQIDLGNSDADRLRQIRTALEKASSTVTAIKNLVHGLTATDGSAMSKIEALLTEIGNIAGTFAPDGPSSK